MVLSAQQLQAIEQGEAVELTLDGTRCVVVRKDVYQTVASAAEPNARETYPAVLKALDQFDESPDQYLEYLDE